MTSVIEFYVAIAALASAGSIGIGISMVQADYTYVIDGVTTKFDVKYTSPITKCGKEDCWWITFPKNQGNQRYLGVTANWYNSKRTLFNSGKSIIDLCGFPTPRSWEAAVAEIAKRALFPDDATHCPINLQTYPRYEIFKEFGTGTTIKDRLDCDTYNLAMNVYDHGGVSRWQPIGSMLVKFKIPWTGECDQ